jgi:hypothetical protein
MVSRFEQNSASHFIAFQTPGFYYSPQTNVMDRDYPIYFMKTMQEYLSALKEVYPNCLTVRGYEMAFRMGTKNKGDRDMRKMGTEAIAKYKHVMEPWYARCLAKDEGLLGENIEFLTDLGMQAKWATMDSDTKDVIWQYIIQFNQLCGGPAPVEREEEEVVDVDTLVKSGDIPDEVSRILEIMPASIKQNIMSMSEHYSSRIHSGEMGLADLNMFEMATHVQGMVDPADMSAFSETLKTGEYGINPSTVTSMLAQMPTDIMPPMFSSALSGLIPKK